MSFSARLGGVLAPADSVCEGFKVRDDPFFHYFWDAVQKINSMCR